MLKYRGKYLLTIKGGIGNIFVAFVLNTLPSESSKPEVHVRGVIIYHLHLDCDIMSENQTSVSASRCPVVEFLFWHVFLCHKFATREISPNTKAFEELPLHRTSTRAKNILQKFNTTLSYMLCFVPWTCYQKNRKYLKTSRKYIPHCKYIWSKLLERLPGSLLGSHWHYFKLLSVLHR